MAIDLDTAQPVKQNEFGATIKADPIDMSTAKPVPQLIQRRDRLTGRPDERYVRPLTDMEKDQSTAEMVLREHGQKPSFQTKVSQALESSEGRAIEGGVLTMGFSPMLDAIRGVTSAEVPETSIWNTIIDSAKKGVLEPDKNEPTSVAVLKDYPNMDWRVAGVLGTVAEIGFTTNMLEDVGKVGADVLSRDTQATKFINRLRGSEEWNRNVSKIAEAKGIPVSQVDDQLARAVWASRNDANYWSILRANIKDSFMNRVPVGLSTEDVSGGLGELGPVAEGLPAPADRGEKIVQSAVRVGSQVFYGATHEDALNKAGLSKEVEEKQKGLQKASGNKMAVQKTPSTTASKKSKAVEGKDFEAFLVDDKKNLYTRQQSQLLFGVGESSHIEQQGSPQAKSRMTKARKEVEDQQTAAKMQFVKGRINQLQGESDKLWSQIKLLGGQRDMAEKSDLPVTKIANQVEDLLKKADKVDAEIERLYLGDTMISNIKNEMLSLKAKDLMTEQDAIEADAMKKGTLEGKLAERERWQLKTEKEKKAQLETEARQRTKAIINREIKKMARQIEELPTKNLPIEYKDKIDEIKSNFDFKGRSNKTLARRESMQEFVAQQLEQGNEINIPTEKLDLIHRVPINEMTYGDVKDVYDAIMRLHRNGSLKDRLLTQRKEMSFDATVKQAVSTITKGQGITPETTIIKALREQDKSWKEEPYEALRWYVLNNLRPEIMYMALDGWSQGVMSGTCWDALYRGENGEMVDSDLFHTVIGKTHENLPIKDFQKKYDVGRFKGMTKSNAMFIYANSFNEGNLAHLEGSGITDKDIKDVEAFLTPSEKKSVGDMIKFFDNYMYPRLDKTYSRINGVHMAKEDNYFPIDRLEDVSYDQELERDLLARSFSRRAGVSKGFTKGRVSSTKGFSDFDYFGTLYRHLDKVSHYLNFAEPVRDVQKMLLNPEIRAAIQQKFGQDYYDILNKHLKDVAAGRLSNHRELLGDVLDFIRTRATPLYLGYNLLTTLKQTAGLLQGMEMAGQGSTMKALVSFVKSPRGCLAFVDSKSPMMKFRSMRQEREFQEIIANRSWQDKLGEVTGFQWLQEKSLVPTLFVDRMISNVIWRGAYGESMMKGMDEKEAIETADRAVRLSQPMGGLIHLPHMFRGSKPQRMLTFLKGHTNKLLNLQMMMAGQKKDGKTSNGRFASQLLFYTILPAVTMAYFEMKRLPENIREWIGAIGKQATVSLWGIEEIFNSIEHGRPMGGGTPLDDYIEHIVKLFTSKKVEKKIDEAVYLAAGFVGAPYVGAKRFYNFFTGQGGLFGNAEKSEKDTRQKKSEPRTSPARDRARERVKKIWD